MLEQLEQYHPLLPTLAALAVLIVAALISRWVAKHLLVRGVEVIVMRTRSKWDDALAKHRVFGRLAHIVPAMVVYIGWEFVPGFPPALDTLIHNLALAYMILMLTLAISALLSAVNGVYETYEESRERPIKGFVQLLQIIVFVFGGVLIISALLDRSPLLLLSGVGAMTAILLLIFKDTILSLVASVQMTAQDMVRVGDWIEMPQFGADGDVIDMQLHTVKVQNWDKTITTIPTHRLISDSFKNWRGMSLAGGRRIKRSLSIDLTSVRFLEDDEIERLQELELLRDYIDGKKNEIDEYNTRLDDAHAAAVNQRRLTNIGTFRAYAFRYLQEHPLINNDLTLLVRQLQPGAEGLPIEFYCFTDTTAWAAYENIQSDLFDHIIAITPTFGLKLFQQPTGADLVSALSRPDGD